MRARTLIAAVLAGGGLVALGWMIRGPGEPPPASASTPAARGSPANDHRAADVGVTREQLRALLREELARLKAEGHAVAEVELEHESAASERRVERTADQLAAEAAANKLLDTAIASGRWTSGASAQWRALVPRLEAGAVEAFLSKLTTAVNEQRLDLEAVP